MKHALLGMDAKERGAIDLAEAVFGLEPRKDILHRVVTYQLAKRRGGTHKAKERGEVALVGRKSVRQKGSGGARHGDRKANLFRGGGVSHGPRPRRHAHALNKKIRALGLKHALSAKRRAEELLVVEEIALDTPKTAVAAAALKRLGLENALFIGAQKDVGAFRRAISNIPNMHYLPVEGANVYDILKYRRLVLSKAAVAGLQARLA